MKTKLLLLLPVFVFSLTSCGSNQFAAPKNKIKYQYKDLSKLTEAGLENLYLILAQGISNFANVKSYEYVANDKYDYSRIYEGLDKKYKDNFKFNDENFFRNEKTTIYQDNVIETEAQYIDYESMYKDECYNEKYKAITYFTENKDDPNYLDQCSTGKMTRVTPFEKCEYSGHSIYEQYVEKNSLKSYLSSYVINSSGIDLGKLFAIDTNDPFFFGKDKKGNYYFVIEEVSYSDGYSIFDKSVDDMYRNKYHYEYEFKKIDGEYCVTSSLYTYTCSYIKDLFGKPLEKEVVENDEMIKSSFEYGKRKAASKHGKTELIGEKEDYTSFSLYEFGLPYTSSTLIARICYKIPYEPVYLSSGTFTGPYGQYVLCSFSNGETKEVKFTLASDSTHVVEIVNEGDIQTLKINEHGFYYYSAKYDKALNQVVLHIYRVNN